MRTLNMLYLEYLYLYVPMFATKSVWTKPLQDPKLYLTGFWTKNFS